MTKIKTNTVLKTLDGKPMNGKVEAFVFDKASGTLSYKDGEPIILEVEDNKLERTFKSVVVRCLRIEGNSREMAVAEKLDYYDLIMKTEKGASAEYTNSEKEIIKKSLKYEDILVIGQINELLK